jgi:Dynamin family
MVNAEEVPMSTQASAAASSDAQILGRLGEIADELGEVAIATDIRQLATRIHEGRFFVACVGQFKRGKSTLLDAFVGEPILPTGVVPVTAVPTVLRHGNSRAARVLTGGKWRMTRQRSFRSLFPRI